VISSIGSWGLFKRVSLSKLLTLKGFGHHTAATAPARTREPSPPLVRYRHEGLVPWSNPETVALSDGDLVRLMAGGDRDALAPLMERHYRRLYRVALAYVRNADDAQDVLQETFVKAFRHAGRWDGSAEVGRWLTRIAVNQAIDRYRRERRRRASMEPLEEGDHDERVADTDPSPERRVASAETVARIDKALRALPERQRAVFVLRHYEEMSLEDIGRTLGIRLGTVKSSLHRAVQGLRQRLEGLRA
jgi:RNA polymerase sigma-70 factor (ECF subfamily)